MKLLIDEDSQGKLIVRLLRDAGHDVLTVGEALLESHVDEKILALAKREGRTLLTRNVHHFLILHNADQTHVGILAEHQDKDPSKNMSSTDIVQAIGNLEASGWDLRGQFIAINAWDFAPPS